MYQPDLSLSGGSTGFNPSFDPLQLTELALRSAEQFYDMNVSATRALLQTQASTAAAFGLPDWSPLFEMAADQTRQVMSASGERVLSTAQRASDVANELQRGASQLIESHTAHAAQTVQRTMEELNAQTAQSLGQLAQAQGDAQSAVAETFGRVQETAQRVAQAGANNQAFQVIPPSLDQGHA